MRVGVTAHFQFSVFSGGGATSVLSIAELFRIMGHSVTLINVNGTQEWWEDMHTFKQVYPKVNIDDVKEPFDLVLEVGTPVKDKETRQRIGKHCIWVIRKPVLVNDIENSIFPVSVGKRNTEGITAVWCLDQEVFDDELQYLETLTRVPAIKVPFVWSPATIELYRKEAGHPSWIQVAVSVTQQMQKVLPWSVHICETNNSATSSCTIPLVVLRELKLRNEFALQKYKLHNSQPIENSEFFKQNVFAHTQVQDLSGELIGRQRVVDWILDPMSCILAHMRFRRIRPYLLEALWCGIPLVHNSKTLKFLGCGYESYYYEDNSISGAVNAMTQIQRDISQAKGMFHPGNHQALQQRILEQFSPVSIFVQSGWKKAIDMLSAAPTTKATVPVSIPLLPPTPPSDERPVLRVLFTDMWDDFNAEYNMFLLLLQEGSKQLSPKPRIEGHTVQTLPAGTKPNIVFFGPFGNNWKEEQWSSIPKVHFTGENTQPIVADNVFLNLGFPHADFVDERYVRLPLWMLEIDWFGADAERIVNPKPLPLDRCMKVYPEEIGMKDRFCAFVVTNPCNPVRNSAFHWLSQYKKVDSAGRLFNNVGDEIFAGLGGGGGELKKHEFLKKYKFCLAYENSSSQGYTTEKLLHAKVAGCIPIYWGDPKVERDFDPKGFIDARKFTTPEDLIEAVRKVDSDPSLYLQTFATPALDDYKRDIVRRTFSQIAYAMLKAGLPQLGITQEKIPRFLGATTSEEAKALRAQREELVITQTLKKEQTVITLPPTSLLKSTPANPDTVLREDPLFITMASQRFLPSLHQLLSSLQAQRKVVEKLDGIVYLAGDVPESAAESLRNNFSTLQFRTLPKEAPQDFPDYWDPQHFAWKLWILNEIVQDKQFAGRLVCYMDSGIFPSRIPKTWFQLVTEEGICLLEDPRQTNKQWCHDDFCKALQVTEDELQKQQLWAGCMAFVHGTEKATKLFTEAYQWSKQRAIIVGPKWAGVRDGKPFGHRHDQSILSILSQRMSIPRYPMDEIYCDESLRKTFLTGKALYVHRGGFTLHKPFSTGIDEAYVINLDRRADRMEKLYTNNPELKGRVTRLSAFEGTKVQMSSAIARLFKPNDFFWKKPILGCALSHLQLWWQLLNEKPEIQSYLILEDDVKLQPGWEDKWKEAAGYVPEDADIVYLGGILPPNRPGFETVKEKINAYFSRVGPNAFFGQHPPNRYFHFCNYSYILTRQGVEKIFKILDERDGYWTSADHMVCNRVDRLNHYFLDPLVAGCYQDDDPKYQSSQFNNFSRIDQFDSDLWNNDERFSALEVEMALQGSDLNRIDIQQALKDGKIVTKETVQKVKAPIEEITVGNELPRVSAQLIQQLLAKPPSNPKRRFVTLEQHKFDGVNAYEREWIQELLGKETPFVVEPISATAPAPTDVPIVIVQRPHIEAYTALFQRWDKEGKDFYVFHVSDEHRSDTLDFYLLPHCLGIVRMYQRNDIPLAALQKTTIIPLGYHWTLAGGSDDPMNKTPRLPFRNVAWSFYGTAWQDRHLKLQPLQVVQPHSLKLVDSWESPDKITRNQYIAILLDSLFVPCPQGNNIETYRLYEALECGCIPLYVKAPGDESYVEWLQNEIGLLPVSSWAEAAALVQHFMREKEVMEGYRNTLLLRWKMWKERLATSVRKTWTL
jgi:GR25 family glycosyltransferase involved in LPS biosynthesis